MATSPMQQVASTSIDLAGISVCTDNPSVEAPQQGSVYDPTLLAAAVPIGFVPYDSSTWLMINSQRWTSATATSGTGVVPGYYSAYTTSSTPNWFLVDGATGTKSVINAGPDIPMTTTNSSRTLKAVESRSPHFVYTLYDVVNGSVHTAVIQVWLINTATKTVTLIGEETIPTSLNVSTPSDGTDSQPATDNLDGTATGSFTSELDATADGTVGIDSIVFSTGLFLSGPYMHVFGTGSSTNQVYMARKLWGHLGTTINTSSADKSPDPYWEYKTTSQGWSTDSTQCSPLMTTTGVMTTQGPISVAQYTLSTSSRTSGGQRSVYRVVSTVTSSGTARTAQMYSSLNGRPWVASSTTVPLGGAGTTYMGGGLQFQQQLAANPALVPAATSATAIPYVIATKATSGTGSQVSLTWGVWQIPRQQ